MALMLLRKFWYVPLLLGLFIYALLIRNDLTRKGAALDVEKARVADLATANQGLGVALTQVRLQRIDNDAIALAVAAKVGKNQTIEKQTETIIEKAAANDPVTRSWADSPLPSGVRDALRAN